VTVLDEMLSNAVWAGDLTSVRRFIARGARASALVKTGTTALHYATIGRRIEIATLLLESGTANVNAPDARGRTPLHLATAGAALARGGEMICLLLNRGADPTREDRFGETPVGSARRYERRTGRPVSYLFDIN
jgi:ankyrin repeat protein